MTAADDWGGPVAECPLPGCTDHSTWSKSEGSAFHYGPDSEFAVGPDETFNRRPLLTRLALFHTIGTTPVAMMELGPRDDSTTVLTADELRTYAAWLVMRAATLDDTNRVMTEVSSCRS